MHNGRTEERKIARQRKAERVEESEGPTFLVRSNKAIIQGGRLDKAPSIFVSFSRHPILPANCHCTIRTSSRACATGVQMMLRRHGEKEDEDELFHALA